MIKSTYTNNDTKIQYFHAPNIRTSKIHISKTEFKQEMDRSTMSKDFNTPLSSIFRTMGQRISEETNELNTIIKQQALIDIYRTLHPAKEKKTASQYA